MPVTQLYRVVIDESFSDATGRTVDHETAVEVEATSPAEANLIAEDIYGAKGRIFEAETDVVPAASDGAA